MVNTRQRDLEVGVSDVRLETCRERNIYIVLTAESEVRYGE
jgi:hypothetical protein